MEEAFRTGRLLLGDVPSGAAELPAEAFSWVSAAVSIAFVLLFLLFLGSFLHVLPYLADSFLRARGSAALESSVRVSRDRNIIAAVFVLPSLVLIDRYRLYDPDFVQFLSPNGRFLTLSGVMLGYLLLRALLSRWVRPRRRREVFSAAYHAGFTFFILLVMIVLLSVGLLYLFHASDTAIRAVILVETAVIYGLYIFRRGQILSAYCYSLTTFLYLCALEFLPTALLVASAVIL